MTNHVKKYKSLNELSRDKFLTPSECSALCSMPPKNSIMGLRDYAILKTFLNAGLRKSELCNLNVGDLRVVDGNYYFLVHSKGGNIDEQDIGDMRTIDAIKKYILKAGHSQNPDAPLFQPDSRNGNYKHDRMNRGSIDNLIDKYAKQAEISKKVTAHMLRHTYGAEVMAISNDLQVTQRAMRHRSPQATLIYLHTTRERVRANLRNLHI